MIKLPSHSLLTSDRLYLRAVCPNDVSDRYYRWMNDPEVTKFIESRFLPQSKADILEYVKRQRNDDNTLFLAIILKDMDFHIGNITLDSINWNHRLSEIGIIIGEKRCWGKGYASEAITLLTKFAFCDLNLHKLIARCYAPNEGSLNAFKKAGFETEGVRKKHWFLNSKFVDAILMGKINTSFLSEALNGW